MFALRSSACYHSGMARSVDQHKPDCRCPACQNRGRGETVTVSVRVSPSMATWIREQGGADYLRALLERERQAAQESDRA